MSRGVGSTRTLKKILLSLMAVGAVSALSVGGTFAILKSEETNAGSTVASGTFTFSNTVGSSTCTSNSGPASPGNENTSCSTLYTTPSLLYPGGSQTSTVTLTNTGSVSVGDLGVYMASCTKQTSPGAGANAGGGDPCSYITDGSGNPDGPLLAIQETNSSGTATYCWWPDDASGACSPSLAQDDWFGIVAQYVNTQAGAIDLGAGPAAGAARYFKITVGLPSNADPTLQGEEALFSLTWHATT